MQAYDAAHKHTYCEKSNPFVLRFNQLDHAGINFVEFVIFKHKSYKFVSSDYDVTDIYTNTLRVAYSSLLLEKHTFVGRGSTFLTILLGRGSLKFDT